METSQNLNYTSDMKANDSNVLAFLGSSNYKTFVIPPFQRNYEWNYSQCDELFSDIVETYKKKKSHYLGNIVYYCSNDDSASFHEYILVDGQQRITTIALLLCAIRDTTSDSDLKSNIENQYLLNNSQNKRYRLKLKQTSYDYDDFANIVDKNSVQNKESNIFKNYEHFKELLKRTDIPEAAIYNTIARLEIVDVDLKIENDLEAVQTIFEKINSTGKPLSAADLIRNYLLISKTSAEQEKLYKNYWTKIESNIGNEKISKFAHDFLVMKTFDDVEKDEIYKKFKNHFNELETSHEDILKEMTKYSPFFAWLIFENCPDSELNRHIKELNALQTDDVYPLYIYILEKLYGKNNGELEKIFNLLSDFLLRYRIVTPSGGGGTLRGIVEELIEKFEQENLEVSYDKIYFELSNSANKSGRFPDDEEFKAELKKSKKVNHRYGKVLMLKIDESETKNIQPDISQVTVEHLMPQTLDSWWIKYLGGEEKASEIRENYLNCIGNLAIMSQGYNSQNSNNLWKNKLEQLKKVQFNLTREVSKFQDWTEKEIQERNENMAERACKAVTSPLPRTRNIRGIELDDGYYPISQISLNMNGMSIKKFKYGEDEFEVSAWNTFFKTICEMLNKIDSVKFAEIVSENKIHKSTKNANPNRYDPILTVNKNDLVGNKKIEGTNFFMESTLSSSRCRVYAKQLLDIYGLTDKVAIYVENENKDF